MSHYGQPDNLSVYYLGFDRQEANVARGLFEDIEYLKGLSLGSEKDRKVNAASFDFVEASLLRKISSMDPAKQRYIVKKFDEAKDAAKRRFEAPAGGRRRFG